MSGITDERLAELIAELRADMQRWPGDANPGARAFFLEELSAYQELQQRRAADRWIPVSERLPDEEGRYLVRYQTGNIQRTFIGDWFRDGGQSYWSCVGSDHTVTHWRPLPAPPVTERKEP